MVTIVYAYRNRELSRIKSSLDSLENQSVKSFKVVFVDYGSELELAHEMRKLVESYSFAQYYYVHAQFLLWNKSKALNYGIKKVTTEYVFIADVDLIFSSNAIMFFNKIKQLNEVNLFKLAYLDKQNSLKLNESYHFEDLKPKHFGTINGMILVSKQALEKVQGYDAFFHFYSSEDVDLYNRLANADYKIINRDETLFYHNWHIIYASYNDKKMSVIPRLYNVKRINEQHYFSNIDNRLITPNRQSVFGSIVSKEDQIVLKNPTITVSLKNIQSHVSHFFNEQIKSYENAVVKVIVKEDLYYRSIKHYLKKILNKQTQPYVSMKIVNDIILNKILYEYREFNYSYLISEDLKTITFVIKL
jgi:hypothetical protein